MGPSGDLTLTDSKLEAMVKIQSNLYKTTTLGTTKKWTSWTGGHLMKHLYKKTTNQIWPS